MDRLNVPPAKFDQQMGFLARNGYNVITLEEFINYKDKNRKLPQKSIIITFDDGYQDNYFNALPILEKYRFKGTFFVVTDYIGTNRIFPWLKLGEKSLACSHENMQQWLPLTREQIGDMSRRGACFGSHSKSHSKLSSLAKSKLMEELKGSKEHLERILQRPVRYFAYPYGDVQGAVKAMVRFAGYSAAVGVTMGSNTGRSDILDLRRIEITGQDSMAQFGRKVGGGYDWLEYWLLIRRFMRRLTYRR